MTSPNDWAHYCPSTTSDSTVISTGPGPSPTQPIHSIETGRVGKSSARKRTRASRRAPTTLLNTDPTNFRAMVQQFTGAPTGSFNNPARPVISFGFGGDRIQQQQQQQQQPPGPFVSSFGRQYDGAVTLPGGEVSEGYNVSSAASATSLGFFFDGMMGGDRRAGGGGYFL